MAGYVGADKLVTSDYLYRQFQSFDIRRADKLDEALFITTPEHYEQNDGSDPDALEIVADGTGIVGNQIEQSNVTPLKDGDLWSPQIGEYAVLVAEVKKDIYLKAATLNIEDTELDKKANNDDVVKKTDITTTINNTSTNDTVPSAKAVYNNVLKKCSNLGVITGDDFIISENTDLNNITTEGTYRCKAGSTCNTLINSPITGQAFKLIVNVGNSDFLAQYLVVSNTENFYPYVRTKHSLGTWGKWKKLCATSVADVPKTTINYTDTTYYEPVGGSDYNNYEVVDGICYVTLFTHVVTSTNSLIVINESLPKPKKREYKTMGAWTGATDSVCCIIDINGGMSLNLGTVGSTYIQTFSYPVAE